MRRAFTLVELLVVVLLLGLVAGVALVSLDGVSAKARLEATARCIEQAFRLARSEAITSGLPRRLVFDPRAHAVVIHRPRIGQEGLVWAQGPRLAWSEHVSLAPADSSLLVETSDAQGAKQILLSVWPDGVGQVCQLQLSEAGQRVDVMIDGLNVSSRRIEADKKDAQVPK
jgi:type II secretion system protein H